MPIEIVVKSYRGRSRSSGNIGNGVYVGRPTKYGNPYTLHDEHDDVSREKVCDEFEAFIIRRPDIIDSLLQEVQLRIDQGFHTIELWCWCTPRRCHADTYKRILEQRLNAS